MLTFQAKINTVFCSCIVFWFAVHGAIFNIFFAAFAALTAMFAIAARGRGNRRLLVATWLFALALLICLVFDGLGLGLMDGGLFIAMLSIPFFVYLLAGLIGALLMPYGELPPPKGGIPPLGPPSYGYPPKTD